MNQLFLLLGSNIDKEVNLVTAVSLLRQCCRVIATSSVYESTPRGLTEQPPFFNAAVLIETPLAPAAVKTRIITPIEQQLKRVRRSNPNAPRTIDLDIILFNDAVLDYLSADGRLRHLPDPDLLKFAHIAVPAAEIAPQKVHPETGQTLAEIARQLMAQADPDMPPLVWSRPEFTI